MVNPRSKKAREAGELSQTAKTYIENEWLRINYGYDKPVVTDAILKGQLCEQDSIALLDRVKPAKNKRWKNRERKTDGFFTGCCDLDLKAEDTIEDLKTSWDMRTFFEVKEVPTLYYAQGQVYMYLYRRSHFRLHYCLVDTPEELILEEEKKFYFKFNCNEENRHYIECCEKIRNNHSLQRIPIEKRVKTFEFERDDKYIEELKGRVVKAREYYKKITL